MRKRTVQHILATVVGAVLGGLAVFLILEKLGSTRFDRETSSEATIATAEVHADRTGTRSDDSTPSPLVSPTPTPPLEQRTDTEIRADSLGVAFALPFGYRIATSLNLLEAAAGLGKRFTLTRASVEQEEQYNALVKDLRLQTKGTEAPAFAPGVTLTIQEATGADAEKSDATFAREKEPVTTPASLSGTRYRRVEGLQTYDITYLNLPGGRRIALHMTYSTEEPRFDEAAYRMVLESLHLTK